MNQFNTFSNSEGCVKKFVVDWLLERFLLAYGLLLIRRVPYDCVEFLHDLATLPFNVAYSYGSLFSQS